MMKALIHISLNVLLLLVFTAISPSVAWACGKSASKKEVSAHSKQCQKACCKKAKSSSKSHCQNACCKKHSSDTQKQKKGCCGDGDCSCSFSTTHLADLPKLFVLDMPSSLPVFIFKNDFFYKRVFTNSSINDIWQPPISDLSI